MVRPEELLGVARVGKKTEVSATSKRRTQARPPTVKYGITLYPSKPKTKFKKRLKSETRKSWAESPIAVKSTNSNLNNMHLTHWIRKDHSHRDYPYAKLNKKIRLLQYNKREWKIVDKGVHDEHPSGPWSKQETDLLFALCDRYDIRFTIIHDRYAEEKHDLHKSRTMEELKDRFYSIQRKLMQTRNPSMSEKEMSKLPQFAHAFKFKYACDRRDNLNNILNRQASQNKDMAQLVDAMRKNKDAIRKKKVIHKEKRRQLREQRAFMHSRVGADLRKSDCILTTGGAFGYNCGRGVIIKDEWRSIPPATCGPLHNRPRHCIPKPEKRKLPGVYNQDDDGVSRPIKYKVNCGPSECKTIMVQLPPPEDPALARPTKKQKLSKQKEKEKKLKLQLGYEMSMELEKRLSSHSFVNFNDKKGPFSIASGVLLSMYKHLQEDLLSQIALEKIVAKRKAQADALKVQYAKMHAILHGSGRRGAVT